MLFSVWCVVDIFLEPHTLDLDPGWIDRRDIALVVLLSSLAVVGALLLEAGWPARTLGAVGGLHLVAVLLHLVKRGWPQR